jgi:hypothetical protein
LFGVSDVSVALMLPGAVTVKECTRAPFSVRTPEKVSVTVVDGGGPVTDSSLLPQAPVASSSPTARRIREPNRGMNWQRVLEVICIAQNVEPTANLN